MPSCRVLPAGLRAPDLTPSAYHSIRIATPEVNVDSKRDKLSQLLGRLQQHPKDHGARVRAARIALEQSFRAGDPHFADVAESLLVDIPRLTPKAARTELSRLAAQAKATRRAVAMAHRLESPDPHEMAHALAADPDDLADEVTQRVEAKQPALAKAVLEVALSRHRDHPRLRELQQRIEIEWPWGAPSTDEPQ